MPIVAIKVIARSGIKCICRYFSRPKRKKKLLGGHVPGPLCRRFKVMHLPMPFSLSLFPVGVLQAFASAKIASMVQTWREKKKCLLIPLSNNCCQI